ncbi:hypothetical protein CASFOL_012567 [Castilleja foliolosa]|uniref:BTB domain-containing protein n=1 Tax=Castilleja foliolosa TaxID=1961234 RepID=A0ABD3DJ95_9LAMI
MEDTAVDVIARLAQWKTDGGNYSQRSEPFKINGCDWRLTLFKRPTTSIRLSVEPPENQLHFDRLVFVLRVTGANRELHFSTVGEIVDETLSCWYFYIGMNFQSWFVISVEFLDFKISLPNGAAGIFPGDDKLQHLATQSSSRSFSHMLVDSDITISTSDGELRAHKEVLSTSSPVFRSMFTHDLISSTIEIKDMTSESCLTLLRFLYGSVTREELWKHRLVLLGAANKYDITNLKDVCEESLLEDINADNVFDRLQEAWLYKAGKLKRGCFRYLLDFGMINHISREEIQEFLRKADRELAVEMFSSL